MNQNYNKRWYDCEPTLSLAISLFENSTPEAKEVCSNYIINEAKEKGVTINNNFREMFEFHLRRWYDKDKLTQEAMEYLRIANIDIKKEIALQTIKLLQKMDCEE